MKRIYATFGGTKSIPSNNPDYPKLAFVWNKVCDDTGEELKGSLISNRAKKLTDFQLRTGNRYIIECKEVCDGKILYPSSINHTNKNPKCDLIRFVKGKYLFIKGKYKNKTHDTIDKSDLTNYLIWIAEKTTNEATVKNALNILKKING
jgi:hypothetical protein